MPAVAGLWIYPLKGGAGIPLDAWPLDAFGLRWDRRWMVVDEAGSFLTQRSDPALGRLGQTLTDEALVLVSGTADRLELPFAPPDGAAVRVRVWSDDVDVRDCGAAAASFISRHLGRTARIVHMPADAVRPADPVYARADDRVSFADGFPLLLVGQAALDELNERLAAPLDMRRFRPNIVVTGSAPHAEDAWASIRIGDVVCEVVKPCARCVVTTFDPDTGEAGREPTRTLSRYRRWDGQVWFGQNLIHRGAGTLAVGDEVIVLAERPPEPPLM
jgi:uncharacterized protein YcbX